MYDCIIIGSGPAGLTSALYLARANKKILVILGTKGGQLTTTSYVENYPGFVDPILGEELMHGFYEQAKAYGAEYVYDNAIDLTNSNGVYYVACNTQTICAKSVIVATGSRPKLLGIEENYIGRGVSTCATCDGNFFKNQTVAIIGGGNTAMEEALYLSNIVKKLYIIHRRDEFRGEDILKKRVSEKENIEILWSHVTKSFQGQKKLESIQIIDLKNNQEKTLDVQGAFIAIGHTPNNELLIGKVEVDENGYIKNAPSTEVPGLFVAGDLHDYKYRQAVTAAGYGCMAAFQVLHYLNLQ